MKVKVGGKNISEIAASDLEEITFDQIKKAQEAQVTRERQENIRQRKMENKRVDHLARALREEERDKLDSWVVEIQEQDREFIRQAQGSGSFFQMRLSSSFWWCAQTSVSSCPHSLLPPLALDVYFQVVLHHLDFRKILQYV